MSKIKDTQFSSGVRGWLKKEFPMYGSRFIVVEETQIYTTEREEVWNMKNKQKYKRAEVFLQMNSGSTEYVCDMRSDWPEVRARQAVMIGLNNIKQELESSVNSGLFKGGR